jgi:hypothetical protein
MTDREMLELAANAAGVKYTEYAGDLLIPSSIGQEVWNPFNRDDQALRLAVNLGITIIPDEAGHAVAMAKLKDGDNICGTSKHGDDKFAATRRAIVFSAAQIGQAMARPT